MSLADIFRNFTQGSTGNPPQNSTPPLQPGQVANPNIQPGTNPQVDNKTVPNPGDTIPPNNLAAFPENKTTEGASPLDSYKDLFTVGKDDKAAPSLVPSFTMDTKAIFEAAGKIDFTKAISPELLDKASKGDAASLAQLVNQAAQAGFAQATVTTGNIVKDALTKQADTFKNEVMPDILRRHQISVGMSENPLYTNPAVAPLLKSVEGQLAIKYPTASSDEITKHAKVFFDNMAGEIIKANGGSVTVQQTQQSGGLPLQGKGTDWDSWMSS